MEKKSILFGALLFIGMTSLLHINIGAEKTKGCPCGPIPCYSWKDSIKKMDWEITNRTDEPIIISSDIAEKQIPPNQKARVPREESFSFTVATNSGMHREFQTDNHFVEIYVGRDPWGLGAMGLKMRSYTEWPGNQK